MRTERVDAQSPDRRRVVIWRSVLDERPGAPVVVIGTGFGRRMRDSGSIAHYLASNGAVVYRFDGLDHVGLSDGSIRDFCLASAFSALVATVATARQREGVDAVTLVPVSLSALAAFRYAATHDDIAGIVALLGVVDGRKTLARVFGEDYTVLPSNELPETVRFERHDIDPRRLWEECRQGGWFAASDVTASLSQVPVAVTNIIARDDEWVDEADVRAVFDQSSHAGPRRVVELQCASHGLARNPAALRLVLSELTAEVVHLERDAVCEPTFEQLLDIRTAERRLERQDAAHEPQKEMVTR